jgi:LCP family protein required for cell wall assembly
LTTSRRLLAAVAGACVLLAGGCSSPRRPAIVIGKATDSPAPTPSEEPFVPGTPAPEIPAPQLAPKPAGRGSTVKGPPPALSYRNAVDVASDLLFFLVAGSDARPGQEITRGRADSLHIVAVDPLVRKGTILGLPRDTLVDIPGHGRQKINAALALGGPDLLVQTVRNLTGFPISYYAVTGFEGIVTMTDELGGLDVLVHERMYDSASGADFEPGWHHMDGRQVLAFCRDRHMANGDFTRSQNQGEVIVHTLEKLRAAVSDEGGIRRWLAVLYRHAEIDAGFEDAARLGSLARAMLPSDVVNVVASGEARTEGGQSVVILDENAFALFRDVGADAIADGQTSRRPPEEVPTPEPSPTPTAVPIPDATPAPEGEPG